MQTSELLKMAPGESRVYHVGFLAQNRSQECLAGTPYTASERKIIDRDARAVMALADAGKINLVQRKLGPSRYAYIAQRTAR